MIQVLLHGTPQLRLHDGRALALAPREAALLAWLHYEGDTPRGLIAGRFWPAGNDTQARANLRQLLRRLRQSAPLPLVEEGANGLRLAATAQVSDDRRGGITARLLGGLSFDDAPELADWLAARREAEQRDRLRGRLVAASAALDAGDLDAALAQADAVLADQPEVEQAHRMRMEVFYLRGDRAAAIAAWDDCRHALRQAFGIAPSAPTVELGRLLLAQDEVPEHGPRTLPAVLRRPPVLAGHQDLLRSLALALAAGDSVVLTGPGGIGKSRLLQSLLAPAGAAALQTGARIGDAVDPGSVWRRLARAAALRYAAPHWPADEAAAPLRSPAAQHQAVDQLADMFAHCVAAGLRWLVVEDLHQADEASLGTLAALAGRWLEDSGADAPQLLLSARRDELSPAGRALLDALARHSRVRSVELPPLDHGALRALLAQPTLAQALQPRLAHQADSTDALAQALWSTVGGNPAHVLEALRQLWLDAARPWAPGRPLALPATLVEALATRLQALPPPALHIAHLAAVAGGDFDASLAADALGKPVFELAPQFASLEAAQIFQGGRFSHDLVAQAVQRSLTPALRVPLHREVAAHLARRGARAARIAHHLLAAGETAAAAPWLLTAAEDARARWQQAEAAALFAQGAAALDPVAERPAALRAWCDAVRCALWVDDHAAAAHGLHAARALARQVDEQIRVGAREISWLVACRDLGGVAERAARLCERLHVAMHQLPAAELAYALRVACTSIQHGGPRDDVLALCERARPQLQAAAPEDLALWATAYGASLHWLGHPREAAAVLEPAWGELAGRGDPGARLSLLDQLMRVRHSLGRLDDALDAARRLRPLVRLADARVILGCDVLHVSANLLAARGQAARALALQAVIRARLQRAGEAPREAFEVSHVHVCISAGRHDLAQATLDALTRPPGGPGFELYDQARAFAVARLGQARGHPADEALAALERLPAPAGGPALHHRVMLAALRPLALDALEALVDETHRLGYAALERSACRLAARAAADAGRSARAVALAERALALAGHVDAWGDEPASVWADAVQVFDAAGQPGRAQALAAQAADWVLARARQWPSAEGRQAWLQGNPLHRRLLARLAGGTAPTSPRAA